ncbi:endonuclease domain-containing protein [Plantactinospora soyae]|uniref:endonuclease domain-containing protein n=1 Tax=Plantactinospora soyae TaxID=1544732 RepID=UPI001789EF7C
MDKHLRSKFGINLQQYLHLVEEQGGLCRICQSPPTEAERLVVDHDHSCCPPQKTCGKCLNPSSQRPGGVRVGVGSQDPFAVSESQTTEPASFRIPSVPVWTLVGVDGQRYVPG